MPLSEVTRFPILHSKVHEIRDDALNELFAEINSLRGSRLDGQQVVQLLDQSLVSSEDRTERKPFDKSETVLSKKLSAKIGKLMDTRIYALCSELVQLSRMNTNKPDHIENYHGTSVYVLLNKVFGKNEVSRKRR